MQSTILVGDIGSTKSSWWFHTDGPQEIHLPGYNPITQSAEKGDLLFSSLRSALTDQTVSAIWYYGAGVMDEKIKSRISQQISSHFTDCSIHVNSDLVGAAIAAYGSSPGTLAILGTGSHAANWNGIEITKQASSLGYILGDEGGGCDIGKALIQAYFYNELPAAFIGEMKKRLPNGRTDLFKDLSESDSPNQYLADFAKIAADHKDHDWIKTLVAERINLFVNRHVLPLNPEKQIHVIGSIGYIFADIIREEFGKAGLTLGKTIKNPARALFDSHVSNGKTQ